MYFLQLSLMKDDIDEDIGEDEDYYNGEEEEEDEANGSDDGSKQEERVDVDRNVYQTSLKRKSPEVNI